MSDQKKSVDFDRQPQSRWFSKRSRVAAVLLGGWLAFWVAAVVQPCCEALANEGVHAAHVAAGASGTLEDTDNSSSDIPCPQLFSSDLIVAEQILIPSAADRISHWRVASYVGPMPVASEIPSAFVLDDPPSSSGLYLRTQRWLI